MSVWGDGVGPGIGEVTLLIATQATDTDAGGMLGSVGADGVLHVSDGNVASSHIGVSERVESSGQTLVIEGVVAVGRATVSLGREGLLDGAKSISLLLCNRNILYAGTRYT